MESSKFPNAFGCHRKGLRIEGIIGLDSLVGSITDPLAALTMRAVEEIVPHVDIKGPGGSLPKGVKERIITLEGSCERGVVTRLTELDLNDFHTLGNAVMDGHSIHPAKGLIFLLPVPGRVLLPGAKKRE